MFGAAHTVQVSAPGSLMLLGEHAVLHGRRALVCAIDQLMSVKRTPLAEPVLKIDSELGQYESPLDQVEDHPDFHFVLDAVRQYPLEEGFELKILSDFSSDIGFGSSAAVTVAVHAALMGNVNDRMGLFRRSLATVHRVQGRGSGADVAASVFGGLVVYRAEPQEIHPLETSFPLTAVYSGSKMKTADVIRYLEERRALNTDYFERIFDSMDASVGEVGQEPERLGEMLVKNQVLMEEMGLCNKALSEIVKTFRAEGVPAKISGSGLGDCAIGLGDFPEGTPYPAYPLHVSSCGVQIR
jgi:mevalonate kinase